MTGTAPPPPPKSARRLSHFSSTGKGFQSSISEDENRFVFSFGEKRNLKLVSRVKLTHQPFRDTLCFPKRLPCHIQMGSEEGNCASPPHFFFPLEDSGCWLLTVCYHRALEVGQNQTPLANMVLQITSVPAV